MRRCILLSMIGMFFVSVAVTSHAQELNARVGVHGAYSSGGDIQESKGGFGAQAELPISSIFSMELAVSHFDDEDNEVGISTEMEYTTIGLSAVVRLPVAESVNGYILGGVDYNIVEVDINTDSGVYPFQVNTDCDVDDEVGFHVGAGFSIVPVDNWELFAEYRYTFLELNGDLTIDSSRYGHQVIPFEGDADFGLIKAGVNYLF